MEIMTNNKIIDKMPSVIFKELQTYNHSSSTFQITDLQLENNEIALVLSSYWYADAEMTTKLFGANTYGYVQILKRNNKYYFYGRTSLNSSQRVEVEKNSLSGITIYSSNSGFRSYYYIFKLTTDFKKPPLTTSSMGEIASGTTLTQSINCNIGDLIIASVIARDNGNENVSAGWTLLGRSQVGSSNQTLAFYYKIATSTTESITITQSSSGRIYITMVAFKDKTTATMGTFSFYSLSQEGQITLPNKICLVSASANIWGDGTMIYQYHSSNQFFSNIIDDTATGHRLGTWIDYGGGGTKHIVNNASGGSLAIGYVEIE